MQVKTSSVRWDLLPWVIAILCCLNSNAGVDHGQYLKWASAAVSSDIDQLENEKALVASTGVPFSPWSAGPGLLMAPMYFILSPFQLESGAGLITGYLCVLVFWICFFRAIRHIANEKMAVFGCLLAAIGTPAGYYCCSVSSETFTLAMASYLMLQSVRAWKKHSVNYVGIASATGLLLMMRSYLGVFAWPALACGLMRSKGKLLFVFTSMVTIGCALTQIGVVNHWMTGSWNQNAYSFGDELFHSFDWTAPFLNHVLFDSFHGLVPSHPLVAFGILCVLAMTMDSWVHNRKMEMVVWSVSAVAIIVNIYIQSCWFYWWLAMPSFGMRGLVLVSLPAVLAIVRMVFRIQVLARMKAHNHNPRKLAVLKWSFWAITLFLSLWGWIHLCTGVTNCASYADLMVAFLNTMIGWGEIVPLACLGGALFAVRRTFLSDRIDSSWEHQAVCLLLVLFLAYCTRQFIQSPINGVFVFYLLLFSGLTWKVYQQGREKLERVGKSLAPAALILSMVFFIGLYANTSTSSGAGSASQIQEEGGTFNWPDTRRAYLTLNQVPRFKSQAETIREFLSRRFSKRFVDRELVAMETNLHNDLIVTQGRSFFQIRP